MNLLEQFLREKKDRFINNLITTEKEKEEMIKFFDKHRNLESKIDWNLNKRELKWAILDLMDKTNTTSKTNIKKKIKAGDLSAQFKGRDDCKILYQTNTDIYVAPLAHSAVVFMNSFDCFGNGAKWCIGETDNPRHWNTYTEQKNLMFIFRYSAEQNEKYMFCIEFYDVSRSIHFEVWNAVDQKVTSNHMDVKSKHMLAWEKDGKQPEYFYGDVLKDGKLCDMVLGIKPIFDEMVRTAKENQPKKILQYYLEEFLRKPRNIDVFTRDSGIAKEIMTEEGIKDLFRIHALSAIGEALSQLGLDTFKSNQWLVQLKDDMYEVFHNFIIDEARPLAQKYLDSLPESTIYNFLRLQEKKDHLIKKLNISSDEKEKFIKFFDTHANLENKIDWQKPSDHVRNAIHDLIELTNNTSNKKVKDKVKKGDLTAIWKDKTFKHKIYHATNDFILVAPLEWEAAVFMDSFDCYGKGAKWCIGTSENDKHWILYTQKNKALFLMYYSVLSKTKLMIEAKYWPTDEQGPAILQGKIWNEKDDSIAAFDSSHELNELLGIDGINFNDIFEDLHKYSKKNFRVKEDERVAALIGSDYIEVALHGEALHYWVPHFWKFCDEWERIYGGRFDLEVNNFNKQQPSFSFITSHNVICLTETGNYHALRPLPGENKKEIPTFYSEDFKMTFGNMYDKFDDIEDRPNHPTNINLAINNIKCPKVIIANIYEGISSFPKKIEGDLEFRDCEFVDWQQYEKLPTVVTGTIKFVDCIIPVEDSFIERYKEELTHFNEIEIVHTELDEDYMKLLDEYWGHLELNLTLDWGSIYKKEYEWIKQLYGKYSDEQTKKRAILNSIDRFAKILTRMLCNKYSISSIDLGHSNNHIRLTQEIKERIKKAIDKHQLI